MSDMIHGWRVVFYTHEAALSSPKSAVRLSKGDEWVVTMGNPGIDHDILVQRALIAALEKDEASAKTAEERAKAKERLRRARLEERVAMADRIEQREAQEARRG